jgi:glycosyltransferase involved in cell wall biosynthesis
VLRIYNGAKVTSTEIDGNQEERTTLRHQVRQELGISETARVALTVGRLDSQKGYNDLIPVVPHIIIEFPEVRFVWVGEGKQRDYLVNQVRDYGVEDKVLFLGYRSDVPRLLKSADLFVFPTHYEGLSFALAEAMTHGLPMVTSNASSIPEIIEDKVHGLLFRAGDSCDLLEAIRWALRHPDQMQEMAQQAQLRVQEFSQEKMIQQTLEVWQQLSHTPRFLRLPAFRSLRSSG